MVALVREGVQELTLKTSFTSTFGVLFEIPNILYPSAWASAEANVDALYPVASCFTSESRPL